MFVYVQRNGPPEAINCPVAMCDQCQTPIQGVEPHRPGGIVIWRARPDATQEMATVHKGACDTAYEVTHPGDDWLWEDLEVFFEQLAHNLAERFPNETNVEYLAPAPSGWRQGHYERR